MSKNQKGFGSVELLLILIVLGIIGFIGWYVWHGHKTMPTTPASHSSNSVAKKQSYFVIKEWGLRASYSGSLSLKYTIGDGDNGTNTLASVTSTELVASDPACQNHGGSIERFLPTDTVLPANEPAQQFFASETKSMYSLVNGYYYLYISPQMQCSANASATTLQNQNETAVQAITSKLEAIPAN